MDYDGMFTWTAPVDITNTTALPNSPPGRPAYRVTWSLVAKVASLLPLAVGSVLGNGLVLAAFKTTPSLQTKTNTILASLAVSEIANAVSLSAYFAFTLIGYVFGRPCDYAVADTIYQGVNKLFPQISTNHLVVIGIDRYVAIVHPLVYEDKLTDRTTNGMLVCAWFTGTLMATSYMLWAITAGHARCVVVPDVIPALYTCVFLAVQYYPISVFLVVVYGKIMHIAWRQHVAINIAQNSIAIISVAENFRSNGSASTGECQQGGEHGGRAQKRRHEFKAVYLTAAIVGTFVVSWTPFLAGRTMQLAGVSTSAAASLVDIGAPLIVCNSSFNWIVYAAVSKSFQRAFKKLLIKLSATRQ